MRTPNTSSADTTNWIIDSVHTRAKVVIVEFSL